MVRASVKIAAIHYRWLSNFMSMWLLFGTKIPINPLGYIQAWQDKVMRCVCENKRNRIWGKSENELVHKCVHITMNVYSFEYKTHTNFPAYQSWPSSFCSLSLWTCRNLSINYVFLFYTPHIVKMQTSTATAKKSILQLFQTVYLPTARLLKVRTTKHTHLNKREITLYVCDTFQ